MNQVDDLWNYLRDHGKITRIEAFSELGICELSSRVGELEKKYMVKLPRHNRTYTASNGRIVTHTVYMRPMMDLAA